MKDCFNSTVYSGSSCKRTPMGYEKGVHNWSWPLGKTVLISGY